MKCATPALIERKRAWFSLLYKTIRYPLYVLILTTRKNTTRLDVVPRSDRTLYIFGTMRVLSGCVYFIICVFLTCSGKCSDFEQELRLLSKQVRVLLEKRTEDVKMIEENIRKTIYDSEEMDQMRKEIETLR